MCQSGKSGGDCTGSVKANTAGAMLLASRDVLYSDLSYEYWVPRGRHAVLSLIDRECAVTDVYRLCC